MKISHILSTVRSQLDNLGCMIFDAAPRIHLAILREPYLQMILDGRKTIESRFSVHATLPWCSVSPADVVILKRSSGPIVGLFVAGQVGSHLWNKDTGWAKLHGYSNAICGGACEGDGFWEARANKRYATLISIDRVIALRPFWIEKHDQRAWLILRDLQTKIGVPT